MIGLRKIKSEKLKTFNRIVEILEKEDVEKECEGMDRIILEWFGMSEGVQCEYVLCKTPTDPEFICDFRAITINSFKSIKSFRTYKRALLEIGLKVIQGPRRKWFYSKFVTPFNEKLKEKKENQLMK